MSYQKEVVLPLIKQRIGIRSDIRDTYIESIIAGVESEMKKKGILVNKEDQSHIMFIVDFSTWRYQNRDTMGDTPRHLQYRLKELYLQASVAIKNDIR
ncbi:hypothetical protein [Jeotgalibacillus proteolyticus]|uniref:Phage head-tail adapter protein n=1 Tax=Jeotgalibacillus proteolyticus TaxID=2082395 RepID=A0A2S5GG65_9BACL|nr:hypothetical protein [Jeotgalibacillus proteolyticus]PPA71911.1 hypothetical protein C4B60_00600 [Jeotgalibacillus proteolyticus]